MAGKTVSKKDLQTLANLIYENIKADFEDKHLSGNLLNTIQVTNSDTGIKIEIPAEIYNMYLFFSKGVVVHTGKGSYASELNDKGSAFTAYSQKTGKRYRITPHNHIGYIDNAINNAITTWTNMMRNKYDIINVS